MRGEGVAGTHVQQRDGHLPQEVSAPVAVLVVHGDFQDRVDVLDVTVAPHRDDTRTHLQHIYIYNTATTRLQHSDEHHRLLSI